MIMSMITDIIPAYRAAYIRAEPHGNFARVKDMSAMNDLQNVIFRAKCFKRDGTTVIDGRFNVAKPQCACGRVNLFSGRRYNHIIKK